MNISNFRNFDITNFSGRCEFLKFGGQIVLDTLKSKGFQQEGLLDPLEDSTLASTQRWGAVSIDIKSFDKVPTAALEIIKDFVHHNGKCFRRFPRYAKTSPDAVFVKSEGIELRCLLTREGDITAIQIEYLMQK